MWREGGAFSPPRLSLSTLGPWGYLLWPLPSRAHPLPPLLRTGGDSLQEDYSLIPSRSHPRLQNVVLGGREGAERRDSSPPPTLPGPAAPREARQEAEWLSSVHHAPLPWLQLFSSHALGEDRAPFP